jgi:hypothetical protein
MTLAQVVAIEAAKVEQCRLIRAYIKDYKKNLRALKRREAWDALQADRLLGSSVPHRKDLAA